MDGLFDGSIGVQGQANVAGANAGAYALRMQAYAAQVQAFATQVPSILGSFWGNLISAGYAGQAGPSNAAFDAYTIGTGSFYQALSYGAENSSAIPRIGMFVGSAVDGAKGIGNVINGNYSEAIVNAASIDGGIIFGDLGGLWVIFSAVGFLILFR